MAQKQTSQMLKYEKILTEWNKIHRLTGDVKNFKKNYEDAIYPLEFLDSFDSFADIGSGAGFPGLAIAIEKPDAKTYLIEPNLKKSSFLRYAAIELGLKNVEVIAKRVEDCSFSVDLIVSRAVADIKLLLDWSENIRRSDTKLLLYKGTNSATATDSRVLKSDIIQQNERFYIYIKECKC